MQQSDNDAPEAVSELVNGSTDLADSSARACLPTKEQGDVKPPSISEGGSRRKNLSPKRSPVETAGLADLFPYYAGFSFEWACSRIAEEAKDPSSIILDPWNGSGTTTTAARHMGHRAIGVDLNPVANVIASLRLQPANSLSEVRAPSMTTEYASRQSDPLHSWFTPETAVRIRQWVNHGISLPPGQSHLVLAAVFRSVRSLTRNFEGSNPTWVRHAKAGETLVKEDESTLDREIRAAQSDILSKVNSFATKTVPVAILTASAQNLPLLDGSVDFILTSPPYLTRIDYAVAYARELAVLGHDVRGSSRALRSQLMGTTLIRQRVIDAPVNLGYTARRLLKEIASHNSKDSAGYYRKQAIQYFLDLTATLDEVTRVSSESAIMQLVVQDSYYKDIPVPLAEIYQEEAVSRGWEFQSAVEFDVIRSLTTLNTPARAYRKEKVNETVLILRRRS